MEQLDRLALCAVMAIAGAFGSHNAVAQDFTTPVHMQAQQERPVDTVWTRCYTPPPSVMQPRSIS